MIHPTSYGKNGTLSERMKNEDEDGVNDYTHRWHAYLSYLIVSYR